MRWAGKPAHCFGCKEAHPSPTLSREGRGHAHPPPARGRERGSPSERISFQGGPVRDPAGLSRKERGHGQHSSVPTSRAPGRRRQARIRQRPRRPGRQGGADRDQQHAARIGRCARGRVHSNPVDAVGQAGRERGRVPGQGLARQHRWPTAQQQLREGRRDRLWHWRSRPRRSTTSTVAPSPRRAATAGRAPRKAPAATDPRRPREAAIPSRATHVRPAHTA